MLGPPVVRHPYAQYADLHIDNFPIRCGAKRSLSGEVRMKSLGLVIAVAWLLLTSAVSTA